MKVNIKERYRILKIVHSIEKSEIFETFEKKF